MKSRSVQILSHHWPWTFPTFQEPISPSTVATLGTRKAPARHRFHRGTETNFIWRPILFGVELSSQAARMSTAPGLVVRPGAEMRRNWADVEVSETMSPLDFSRFWAFSDGSTSKLCHFNMFIGLVIGGFFWGENGQEPLINLDQFGGKNHQKCPGTVPSIRWPQCRITEHTEPNDPGGFSGVNDSNDPTKRY